jgi:antirestriction protein
MGGSGVMVASDPRVWVGCLACYNDGRLQGEWVSAVDAADFVPCERPTHEEYWCFDLESFPKGSGEMSPMEAARIGEVLVGVEDSQRGAFLAYLENFHGDLDYVSEHFDGAYMGEWGSFREYVEESECIPWDRIPEDLHAYFDVQGFADDLAYGYTVISASSYMVYVFLDQ